MLAGHILGIPQFRLPDRKALDEWPPKHLVTQNSTSQSILKCRLNSSVTRQSPGSVTQSPVAGTWARSFTAENVLTWPGSPALGAMFAL